MMIMFDCCDSCNKYECPNDLWQLEANMGEHCPYYTSDDVLESDFLLSSEGGKEMTEAGMVVDDSTADFTVRWCKQTAAVTSTGFRVRFQDDLYDILSVDHMNFRHKSIKLKCRKVRR